MAAIKQTLLILCLAAFFVVTKAAFGWGSAMHAYLNQEGYKIAESEGKAWKGLDMKYYYAGAIAPDMWYTPQVTGIVIPNGIEEDWEYVRLLFKHSRTIKEASFVAGYGGHISGDVPGHIIYLNRNGHGGNHLLRDAISCATVFEEHFGYPYYEMPADFVLGEGLDVMKGTGEDFAEWRWGTFDEEIVALFLRAGAEYAELYPHKGEALTYDVVVGCRDALVKTINNGANVMGFPRYYCDNSQARKDIGALKKADEEEFGEGMGVVYMKEAVEKSADLVAEDNFRNPRSVEWLMASELSEEEKAFVLEGAKEDTEDEEKADSGAGGSKDDDSPEGEEETNHDEGDLPKESGGAKNSEDSSSGCSCKV